MMSVFTTRRQTALADAWIRRSGFEYVEPTTIVRTGRVRVGAPLITTPSEVEAEITRIDHAIDSLDDDIRGQLSWRAPGSLNKDSDGSGYDSGFIPKEDPSANPELSKGFGPLADAAMINRDKGKSKEKLAAERGFGTKWAAFALKWAAWKKDRTGKPSSIPPEALAAFAIIVPVAAIPIIYLAISNNSEAKKAWDELNTFTSEYQQFYAAFVKLGGKPTLKEAKTPDQKKEDEDKKTSIPWYVWAIGGAVLIGGVVLFLAAPSIVARRLGGG